MAQELYNEGRVVGFSAYEIFKRLCEDAQIPEEDIPDERTWLTSMIGIGASLILQIPANTTKGVHDFPLPEHSALTAAGVIFANPFMGDCEWDDTQDMPAWATKVTSYSPLIKNTSGTGNSPTTNSVPYDNTYTDTGYADLISDFVKITDGIVYTDHATWIQTEDGTPYKDINPNFGSSSSVIRLYIKEKITHDVNVLFTGFLNKGILNGMSGYAQSQGGHAVGGSTDTDTNHWENGGMIGPDMIPWASKIIFSVPSSALSIVDSISRTIPADADTSEVTSYGYTISNMQNYQIPTNSVIDFNSITLTDYYTVHENDFQGNPLLTEDVIDMALHSSETEGYNEIIAWYPGMTTDILDNVTSALPFFPPAVYGVQVTETGENTLVPLDTAAPGTVKCFPDPDQAYAYTQIMPDNYSVYFNQTTNNFTFVTPNDPDPTHWAGTAKISYAQALPVYDITAGNMKAKSIAFSYYDNGVYTERSTDGTNGDPIDKSGTNLCAWDDLLEMMRVNKKLDLFGAKLRDFASELRVYNYIGMDNVIDNLGSKWILLNPGLRSANPRHVKEDSVWVGSEVANGDRYLTINANETPATIHLGKTFIKFKSSVNGGADLKLYISATEPNPQTESIPTGSIGIGW